MVAAETTRKEHHFGVEKKTENLPTFYSLHLFAVQLVFIL
jgi:hypothetical protein